MKTKALFLSIIYGSLSMYGQEIISPLKNNALIYSNFDRRLNSRAGDSLNVDVTWVDETIPFLDDFSTDKRRPIDFSPYLNSANQYYMHGTCVEHKNFKRGQYKFSKDTTREYIFDATKPPLFVDSSIRNLKISIAVTNDIPNCNTPSFIQFFPASVRKYFDVNGNVIFTEPVFDTIISCAFIHEITLKGYKWVDRHAYFNTHLPFMPPSKGVATLDGLTQFGRPYDTIGTNTDGVADYLTSVPFNISNKSYADSTYLSFLYQPQGFGDWPDKKDSLVVEFLDDQNNWNTVFAVPGFSSTIPMDSLKFKRAMIKIPRQIVATDPNYFHDSFTFRFKSYSTVSGNNDHWHIDYVKLDFNRHQFDTIIKDANFVYELPSVLKKYSLIPAKQYRGVIDIKDTVVAINRNILNAPIFSLYKYECKNQNTNQIYGQNIAGIPYRADPLVFLKFSPSNQFNYPSLIPDSTNIQSKVYIDKSDIYESNDTASHKQFFYNEMAYDDGSAERAYGIEGLGVKKVAYRFIIPVKDTLAAIKVLFSNIDVPVYNLVFNFNVWKTIGMNGNKEQIIKTISNIKPIYRDTLNGFVTFGLDEPITVQDTIYIGWTQTDERNLQIGYDKNDTLGYSNIFKMTDNVWSKSSVIEKGTPMMRLILDGKRNYRSPNSSVREFNPIEKETISFYPNPVIDQLTIQSSSSKSKDFVIYDLVGKIIYQNSLKTEKIIDQSSLENGLYIIHFYSENKLIQSSKLQISH